MSKINGAEAPFSRKPLDKVLREGDDRAARNMFDACSTCLNDTGHGFPEPSELRLPEHVLRLPKESGYRAENGNKAAAEWLSFSLYVFLHMIYSSLVDADYLDTERFVDLELYAHRSRRHATLSELNDKLEGYLEELQSSAAGTSVNRARNLVLQDAIAAAQEPPGVYTMTVPTGGGKTLASLSFALKHAIVHGQRRIIIATPFMSITDQTAGTLRSIFGAENVLEHQSSYDFGDIDDEETADYLKLASQNWDVPIIVTTNVQLFESLFSNKPGKSRKVHNIAGSVVILDEAQAVPDRLLKPSLAELEVLARSYGATVVLCSATQPALEGEWPFGSRPIEIVQQRRELDDAFGHRVRYENDGTVDAGDLAERLLGCEQALCIVGTRKEARKLFEALVEKLVASDQIEDAGKAHAAGFFHLSALMVPAHRQDVLETIRSRLALGQRCVVVSTQLIEAGVDVDFPVVYREMAGMDSIVQAAGRCNREGRSDVGTVHVFELAVDGEVQGTSAWLQQMKNISRYVIGKHGGKIDESLVTPFFKKRYQDADKGGGLYEEMSGLTDVALMKPEQIALDYHFIEDDTVSVFVPWGRRGEALAEKIDSSERPQRFARSVQPFCVNLRQYELRKYVDTGLIAVSGPFNKLDVATGGRKTYSDELGLLEPDEGEMDSLVL